MVIKTSNPENLEFPSALAIDMGVNNFYAAVDTFGCVMVLDGGKVKNYCTEAEKSGNTCKLEMFLMLMVQRIMEYCKEKRIEVIFVGCCKKDYLTLCGGKDNSALYHENAHKFFVERLEHECQKKGIRCESFFDESYTSMASSLGNDFVPDYNTGTHAFSGERRGASYRIDENLEMDADVNGALNILRKAGFRIEVINTDEILKYVWMSKEVANDQ